MSCTSLESAALSSLAVAARCALWCSSNGSNSSNIVTYPYNSRVSTVYKCSLVPLLLLLQQQLMSCTSLESAALSSLAVAARCALWCSSNGSNSSNIVTYPYNSRVSTAYKCSLVPLLLLLLLLLLLASRKGGCKILPGAVHENARTDPWS